MRAALTSRARAAAKAAPLLRGPSLRQATRSYGEFPSLVINSAGYHPQGAFAEAQATFLNPDQAAVDRLKVLLTEANAGIVAHFYMDPELQGVLSKIDYPHIYTSDSLAMADAAVSMAEKGVKRVIVMGVDFMSENVRAVLDYQGHKDVEVFRLSTEEIGCTLAASAETENYAAWLEKARKTGKGLHVVYINTSLLTKAKSHSVVPTITCTSSNVIRTILQAYHQIPGVVVWYGPDTHMGANLRTAFEAMSQLTDEEVRAIHPEHDRASIKKILEKFEVYPQGTCVVHEMFGSGVVRKLREEYADCCHTAHLEVPGEMFALASEAKLVGRGAVGSTSDILKFITARVDDAVQKEGPQTVRVTLGTEAGMITPIARSVRETLTKADRPDVNLEIIFPVSSDAIAADDALGTGVVPGVAAGEGCSVSGGCATCKFMKMNDLDGLMDLLEAINAKKSQTLLRSYYPKTYKESVAGRSAAEVGGETILHMRSFQANAQLPSELVQHVLSI
ncbi:Quinolinate synthase [Diplonema papillatum]|nr:Quinolinate synthase [Diplonema papillatum]